MDSGLTGPELSRAVAGLSRRLTPVDPSIVPKLIQGKVVAIDASAFLVSVTIHGDDDTQLDQISFNPMSYFPKVGETVWILRYGLDAFIFGNASSNMFNNSTLGRTPSVELRSGTAIGIPASFAWTRIPFDFKAWDTNGFLAAGSGPWEWATIVTAGLYTVEVGIKWNDATTVPVDRGLRICDDTGVSVYDEDIVQYETGAGTHEQTQHLTRTFWFSQGYKVAAYAAQGGGGPLTILANSYAGPRMTITYQGTPP